jgi:hypothetical protein
MFSVIRKRLTYANVTMTLALVFAMSSGAYAAKRYLITSTKQISPKVLTALKGKTGPAGPAGAAGAQGATGSTGAQGPVGANGETGLAGPQGKEGAAGKEGKAGKEGSPWTAGGTLPSGKTETGVWAISKLTANYEFLEVKIPISFPIPLAAGLDEAHVHIFEGTTLPTGCTGNANSGGAIEELGAEPGNLCVQMPNPEATNFLLLSLESGKVGAGKTGAVLVNVVPRPAGTNLGAGLWAVTAP